MNIFLNFNFGWLNAWLGLAPIMIIMIIVFTLNKDAFRRATDMSAYQGRDRLKVLISTVVYYATVLYTVGVTLKVGTVWFYTGLFIYIIGSVPYIICIFNFSTTPINEPIVKGVYKISRNPMYVFSTLTLLGLAIAGTSYFMILLTAIYVSLNHFIILSEERFCFEKYAESYLNYTKNVPRYFFFF
jgi:protein-S-isoprenylcysteine O-methyltransferase Ste14